jgi:signal transduction histidine kinase
VTWYRSLYWRIAVGFIVCLAVLLVVQGMLFVWMMSTAGSAVPNQPPDRLAQTIAIDVGQAVSRDAALDIEHYVRLEYAADTQPFLITLADGGTVEIGTRFPEAVKTEARIRTEAMRSVDPDRLSRGGPYGRGGPVGPFAPPRGGEPPGPGSPPRRGDRFDMGRGPGLGRGGPSGFRTGRPWPIVANGRFVGLVVVPPQPPFTFLLTRYAPTLLTVAAATLILGAVLAAFVIFGPTRRRLKGVEDAARSLGAGDLAARAPATGDDEVSAVASAFNAMADDLAARTEALVAVDQSRRQLLADVSHELNTPVTAMRGYLETLLMSELPLDQTTRLRYLGIVADETARLERIIGDLLDLARLEGGGGALQIASVPVADLFARVVARHERTAAAAHVTIDAVVEPGAETVAGDRTRLEQALQNLAANALRHAPDGTAVDLRARLDHDGLVTLTVADRGPGIPVDHLPRVFDRFYKVDEARVAQLGGSGGSGLGLSIVKAIVERHGARIDVRSEPGRTIFEIQGLQVRENR